jgi:hypothetical protein
MVQLEHPLGHNNHEVLPDDRTHSGSGIRQRKNQGSGDNEHEYVVMALRAFTFDAWSRSRENMPVDPARIKILNKADEDIAKAGAPGDHSRITSSFRSSKSFYAQSHRSLMAHYFFYMGSCSVVTNPFRFRKSTLSRDRLALCKPLSASSFNVSFPSFHLPNYLKICYASECTEKVRIFQCIHLLMLCGLRTTTVVVL